MIQTIATRVLVQCQVLNGVIDMKTKSQSQDNFKVDSDYYQIDTPYTKLVL